MVMGKVGKDLYGKFFKGCTKKDGIYIDQN